MTRAAGGIANVTDIPVTLFVRKTANESVTSSTTMQDDDHLVVTLPAGRTFQVDFYPAVTGAAAGDVKFGWVMAGGVAQATTRLCIGPGVAVADVGAGTVTRTSRHNVTTAVPYGVDGTQTTAIHETFLVETTTSGASGTLQLQWAQNASSTTATTLSASSYFTVTEVVAA